MALQLVRLVFARKVISLGEAIWRLVDVIRLLIVFDMASVACSTPSGHR